MKIDPEMLKDLIEVELKVFEDNPQLEEPDSSD